MSKVTFLLVILVFMSGCAARFVPPVEQVSLPDKAKIGVFIDVSNSPTHTHIGTTVFNNHVKSYPYEWQLKEEAFATIKRQIEENTPFTVVALSAPLINDITDLNFVAVKDKQWAFIDRTSALRESLLAQGIHAVIGIKEAQTLAELNCSQYGCVEFYSEGYGLFTRSFFGLDRYYASSSFEITAEILDPAVDMVLLEELWEMNLYTGKHNLLDGFKDPVDFNNFTEQEMLPVKDGVLAYIEKMANQISQYLNGNIQQPKR